MKTAAQRSRPTSISDYIAHFPAPVQRVLKQVRTAIRKALPKAEETISYQIPTYKIDGQYVIYFAAFKAHYSIYPANGRLIEAFKDDLEPYEYNNKGTIRFPLDEPVPVRLISRIAKFRAKEAASRAKDKASVRA